MDSGYLLLEGVWLMLLGMGAVVLFLVLPVFCIRLMSMLLARLDSPLPAQPVPATPVLAATGEVDAETLAAILLAVHRHRARRG